MSEKNKGGRPRKYATDAERSKAYYYRKKDKMKELEKKVKKLETSGTSKEPDISYEPIEVEKFEWQKITSNEIALMDIQKLTHLTKTFREKITRKPAIKIELQNLIRFIFSSDFRNSSSELTIEIALKELDPIINKIVDTLQESNQQQTLLYLMEAELANRERLQIRDYKLEVLQSQVEELKKESKDKEIVIKQKSEK
ncbi:MAG: hypothetical protein FK734_12250 [Asgard group archaeon]|nr:hypothetical protein [Asgard group archaeon]